MNIIYLNIIPIESGSTVLSKFSTYIYSSSKYHPVNIRGRYFQVPSFTPAQKAIPFARVNHNKYIVTDEEAMIGTSNWTPDYFLKTGGIGFVFSSNSRNEEIHPLTEDQDTFTRDREVSNPKQGIVNMHTQLNGVFLRDWDSLYSSEDL